MSQPLALYRLQRIDTEMDARRQRVREIAAVLEGNSALNEAQAEVAALDDQLRPHKTAIADLNLEIQTVLEQTKQLTTRLYGGSVSNPKELEDIQDKIAERKRRHESLENTLLETMIVVEELEEALEQATARRDALAAAWEDEQAALLTEQKQLKREFQALKAERETSVADVAADLLELYNDLRVKKRGNAVALLEGENCSICGVGQTTTIVQQVRQGQQIILCHSCGRVLVAM